MNLIIILEQFNNENIYFKPAIENNIIEDSTFVKIIYSNNLVTLNSLFIDIPLKIHYIENYFKKKKYSFDIEKNKEILQKIYTIEENILNKYNSKKCKKHIIRQSLASGFLKVFPNNIDEPDNGKIIIKISGIWETNTDYGLNYKITYY